VKKEASLSYELIKFRKRLAFDYKNLDYLCGVSQDYFALA